MNHLKQFAHRNLLKVRRKGSFTQNFAIVFTGYAFNILLQFLLTPIIARIYGPEAYGVFGIFNAFVINIALVASFMYEQTFVLPREEKDFIPLLQLTIGLSLISSSIIFILFAFFGDWIFNFLNAGQLSGWKYVIGPVVLLVCFHKIISNWILRLKAFRENVPINSGVGLGTRLFNIGYGLVTQGAIHGIILGDILGKLAVTILRYRLILPKNSLHLRLNLKQLKNAAITYKNFPLFVFPSSWLNTVSFQIPVFMLARYFGTTEVGYYALAVSLLEIPMRLLGYSSSSVFFQKAAETHSYNPGDLKRITLSLYHKLLNIGLVPFAFLAAFGDLIFSVVFGEAWVTSGVFAGYLGVLYMFKLISDPLTSIYKVLKRDQILLYLNILRILLSVSCIFAGIYLESIHLAILLFSSGNAILYLANSLIILKLTHTSILRIWVVSVVKIAITFGFFFILRHTIDKLIL